LEVEQFFSQNGHLSQEEFYPLLTVFLRDRLEILGVKHASGKTLAELKKENKTSPEQLRIFSKVYYHEYDKKKEESDIRATLKQEIISHF